MSLSPENKALYERLVWPRVAEGVRIPGASKDGASRYVIFELPAYALEALLNAARAQASLLPPVGWVMVPVEPSGAMVREGSDLFANRFGLKDDILVLPMAVQGVYRAMIAAAPVSGDTHD